MPVELDGRRFSGIGLEVNVDYTAVTVLDLAGREQWFEEVPQRTDDPARVVDLAAEQVRRVREGGGVPLGLTLAVPGLIDRRAGRVVEAPNLGWHDVALAELVRDGVAGGDEPLGVAVDNDANCAARAEHLRGVATGVDDLVYLTGTVGLGAGILSDGSVVRGARGLAGEVGHLRVAGPLPCACGRTGCWEAAAGQRGLVTATGLPVADGEDPVAYAARVAALPDAARLLEPVVAAMRAGVAALGLGLDPALLVLGGSFVPLGPILAGPLEEELRDGFTGPGCRVALSTLGLHAASVGAALDALDDVYNGSRPLPAR
ncbi:ROK family protein [Nocardioides marmoraquaticus]